MTPYAVGVCRWKDDSDCTQCASSREVYHSADCRRHRCADCNWVIKVKTGTIFSDSPLKLLPRWFAAIYIATEHERGISSVQLAHDIGVLQMDCVAHDSELQYATSLLSQAKILFGKEQSGSIRYEGKGGRRLGFGVPAPPARNNTCTSYRSWLSVPISTPTKATLPMAGAISMKRDASIISRESKV